MTAGCYTIAHQKNSLSNLRTLEDSLRKWTEQLRLGEWAGVLWVKSKEKQSGGRGNSLDTVPRHKQACPSGNREWGRGQSCKHKARQGSEALPAHSKDNSGKLFHVEEVFTKRTTEVGMWSHLSVVRACSTEPHTSGEWTLWGRRRPNGEKLCMTGQEAGLYPGKILLI